MGTSANYVAEGWQSNRKKVLHDKYHLVIATKEPQKLGIDMGRRLALVTTGRETFVKLREAAFL